MELARVKKCVIDEYEFGVRRPYRVRKEYEATLMGLLSDVPADQFTAMRTDGEGAVVLLAAAAADPALRQRLASVTEAGTTLVDACVLSVTVGEETMPWKPGMLEELDQEVAMELRRRITDSDLDGNEAEAAKAKVGAGEPGNE